MTSSTQPYNNYTMQQAPQHSLEMSLREHLLAAGAGQPQPPPQSVASGPQTHAPDVHGHHHIDPAIAGSGYPMSAGEAGDGHMSEGGRKGRRELSTSKRAAQNRAAQRAFRQRKEEYIKSLKDQVKEYEQMAEAYKTLQAENYQLRDYIINLQSRLLESHGTFPEPPANIDLGHPHGPNPHNQAPGDQGQQAQNHINQSQQPSMSAPTAPMTQSAAQQLQQAAAQAAAAHATTELNNGQKHGHSHEEAQYLPGSEYPSSKRQRSEETGAGVSSVTAGGNTDIHSSRASLHHPTSTHHQQFSAAANTSDDSTPAHSSLHSPAQSASLLPLHSDSSSAFPAYAPVTYGHLVQHTDQAPQPQRQQAGQSTKIEGDEGMNSVAEALRAEAARQDAVKQKKT